jgi:thiamine biosynthesis lipoprotein
VTHAAIRSVPVMGTIVTIDVVGTGSEEAVKRAFEWFREIERLCNRFDPESELRRLTAHPGVAVAASETLYAAVEFALAVAEDTGGAFDPTVGRRMEARGFNRDYRTGEAISASEAPEGAVSYRDVRLDPKSRTVTAMRPMALDLGAIAKGLAIDLAARSLEQFDNFAIDAGGDLYLAGCNRAGESWSVGIRHPRRERDIIASLRASDVAVCTSGDYERPGPADGAGHHIVDPRTGRSADAVVSTTVVAPTAMLADALATAAFVLGPREGIRLLERHGVEGLLVSPTLDRFATQGMHSDYRLEQTATQAADGTPAVCQNT